MKRVWMGRCWALLVAPSLVTACYVETGAGLSQPSQTPVQTSAAPAQVAAPAPAAAPPPAPAPAPAPPATAPAHAFAVMHPATPSPPSSPPAAPMPAGPGASAAPNYLGCFVDAGDRDLADRQADDAGMSPVVCATHCRARGASYFGVQNGTQCFCGNSYGKYGQAAAKECGVSCGGSRDQMCGGPWRNSVYKVPR